MPAPVLEVELQCGKQNTQMNVLIVPLGGTADEHDKKYFKSMLCKSVINAKQREQSWESKSSRLGMEAG